jgi:hypothetical protein
MEGIRTQREKMLSGFVHVAAHEVRTPWYLKLDTDVVATGDTQWIRPEWFQPNKQGQFPVFISSIWNYSKPRYLMDLLDDWGDQIPELRSKPRLNLPYSSQSSLVAHSRIISWIFFGRNDWTARVAEWLAPSGRLPFPSQDSFMYYCAKRGGEHYVRENMARLGWHHGLRSRRLRKRLMAENSAIEQLSPITSGIVAKKSRGVIYYNNGTSCAVRLLVSLFSLRRHYSGPVTILSEGAESRALCAKIGKALNAEVCEWNCGVPEGRNRAYLAKTRYAFGTPYETTIALDSDTLVVGAIDELFQIAENNSFCVAQLGQWRSNGRTISRRIRQWREFLPADIKPALGFGPAINCGVVAFTRDAQLYQDWMTSALPGRHFFIPDEVCCQVMLHRYPHKVLDGIWNCSCKHDDPNRVGVRIIHYHGRKHCRIGLPFHGEKWFDTFRTVLRQNIADVQNWSPAGDRALRRQLNQKHSPVSVNNVLADQPVYESDLWCRRGHLNKAQADKIATLCRELEPKYAIEVGFCTGRSSATVLHNTRASLHKMISVDKNLDFKSPEGRQMAALLTEKFPMFRLIERSSRELLTPEFLRSEFPMGLDWAMVDGDHSYEGCTFDLEAIAGILNDTGIIVIDDYRSGPPKGVTIEAVTQSVDDFVARYSETFVMETWNEAGKGFSILRKRREGASSKNNPAPAVPGASDLLHGGGCRKMKPV